jgi:hypothetical protein
MNSRSIVLDLHLKGLSVHAIHEELVASLGPRAMAYNTAMPYLGEVRLGITEISPDPQSSSARLDHSDWVISATLEEKKSYSHPRENLPDAHMSQAPPSMESSQNGPGGPGDLHLVSHLVSDAQKVRPVKISLTLLHMLETQEQRAWRDVVTWDA